MSTRRTPDHRGAGRAADSNRRRTTRSAMHRISLGARSFAWVGWAGGAALALLLALGLSYMGQTASHQVASAAPAQKAWVGRASAPEMPAVIHFFDPNRNTAYTVWLRDSADGRAGSFAFTLRDHTQISGFAPITQAADNAFIQSTTQLISVRAATNCIGRAMTDAGERPAHFTLRARIDKSGLVAYAQASYATCDSGIPQGGDDIMASGCSAFTTCNDVLAQVSAAVQQYSASVVAASADRSQDAWNKVYAQVSQTTRAQYTPEQFAAQLNKQIESVGQITSISPITGPPVLQYDTAGQAFFALKQQITYSHNGATTTRDSTSYYLLESGQWVFWFSA